MAPDLDGAAALEASAGDLPIVIINPGAGFERRDTIAVNNFDGAFAVTRHLLELGHRRIAFLAGPERNVEARQRLEGYRAALRAAGLAPDPALELRGDFTEPSGYELAASVLRMQPRPDAVFAANDYMAVGFVGALHDAGLEVPRDIAVAGFDDIPMARYLNPALTTVHVDTEHLGARGLACLLDRVRTGQAGTVHHETVPATLVVRASCGSDVPRRAPGRGGKARRRRAHATLTRGAGGARG
jgi:LacI family transcriptional regulator